MVHFTVRTALVAVVTTFLALAGVAGTANATPMVPSMAVAQALVNRVDNAANSTAAFNSLSSADKTLFKEITTPYGEPKISSGAVPNRVLSPAFSGCWGHPDKVELDNAFGWKLADGYQTTNVCVANGSVYSVSVTNIDGSGAWAYSYEPGHTVATSYNAQWEGRGAVRFAYTVTGTPGYAYLCLRIFVNANGYNWRLDHTCPASA